MSSDAPPHLVFDKSRRFPSDWSTTSEALDVLVTLAAAPYDAAQRASDRLRLQDVAQAGRLRGAVLRRFLAFWAAEFDRLPPSAAAALEPASLPDSHPLVLAALQDDDALNAGQPVWFNSKGGSRIKAGARGGVSDASDSEAEPEGGQGEDEGGEDEGAGARRGAGPSVEPDTDDDEGALGGGNGDPEDEGEATTLSDLTKARTGGLVRGRQLVAAPVVPPPAEGARRRAAAALEGRHGQLEEQRGAVVPPEPAEDDELYIPGVVLGESYLAVVQAALHALEPPTAVKPLPRYAKDYLAAIQARGIAFHQSSRGAQAGGARRKQPLVDAWRMVSQRLSCAYDEVQRIALGEHVTFAELRDSRPGKASDVSEELAAVYSLQQRVRRARPPPLDPFDWATHFDKWATIVTLVNAGGSYERERKEAFAAYKAHVLLQLRRCS
ncbi:hypothetical protein JCM1840_002364 [Sporobolomyces johnsonii]